MSYTLSYIDYTKTLPSDVKVFFSKFKFPDESFFGDDTTLSKKAINSIKASEANVNYVSKLLNIKPIVAAGKIVVEFTVSGIYRFRIIISGKASRSGDAKSTEFQELASLEACRQAILFPTKPLNFDPILTIYPGINDAWRLSFIEQHKIFLKLRSKFGWSKFEIFNHKGGFMDWITNLIKVRFGISKKDTWNPADIWLLNNESSVRKDLEDSKSLAELNDKMIKLFTAKKLVGISLKMCNKSAKYELVNFESASTDAIYPLSKATLNLNLKKDSYQFVNDELSFEQIHPAGIISVQCRAFPVGIKSTIQVSYKLKGGQAEMGKVPAAIRNILLKEHGFLFPSGQRVPTTVQEFKNNRVYWAERIKVIFASKIVNTQLKNTKEFFDNIATLYTYGKKEYQMAQMNQKFQCIELAYIFSKLSEKDLNILLTKFAFLSQKQGDQFGPFIKVS